MCDETVSDGIPETIPPVRLGVPPPDAPSVALRQAITGVLAYCRQLTRAVDDHDFEAVEGIASKAVHLWLSARHSCRRLLTETEHPSPLMHVALATMEDTYQRLASLFQRANDGLRVPRMGRTLANLRARMDAARAEPLRSLTASGAARRTQEDTQKIKP